MVHFEERVHLVDREATVFEGDNTTGTFLVERAFNYVLYMLIRRFFAIFGSRCVLEARRNCLVRVVPGLHAP